jgi:hypothetical protein
MPVVKKNADVASGDIPALNGKIDDSFNALPCGKTQKFNGGTRALENARVASNS